MTEPNYRNCERCERKFPFHQLIPNDYGELFCLKCFKAVQELEKKEKENNQEIKDVYKKVEEDSKQEN